MLIVYSWGSHVICDIIAKMRAEPADTKEQQVHRGAALHLLSSKSVIQA